MATTRDPQMLLANVLDRDRPDQVPTYGQPIHLTYGRMRVAGRPIWGSAFRRVVTGTTTIDGQTVETADYFVSCAIGLCEGPATRVPRIWANGRIIYSPQLGWRYSSQPVARMYLGTETQTADPTMVAALGAANVSAHRGLVYFVLEDFPLNDYGGSPPRFAADVERGQNHLFQVTTDLFARSGLADQRYIASTLSARIHGVDFDRTEPISRALRSLGQAYLFDVVESAGALKCVPRTGTSLLTITESDLGVHEASGRAPPVLEEERIPDADLPKRVNVQYIDQAFDYQQGNQSVQRIADTGDTRREEHIEVPVAFTNGATDARQLADKILQIAWTSRVEVSTSLFPDFIKIEPADVVTILRGSSSLTVRLTEVTIGDNFQVAIEGVTEDAEALISNVTGNPGLGLPPVVQFPIPGIEQPASDLIDTAPSQGETTTTTVTVGASTVAQIPVLDSSNTAGTATINLQPGAGSYFTVSSSVINFDPTGLPAGDYTATYTYTDDLGQSTIGTVTVTVGQDWQNRVDALAPVAAQYSLASAVVSSVTWAGTPVFGTPSLVQGATDGGTVVGSSSYATIPDVAQGATHLTLVGTVQLDRSLASAAVASATLWGVGDGTGPGQFRVSFVDDGAGGLKPRVWSTNIIGEKVVAQGANLGTVPVGDAFLFAYVRHGGLQLTYLASAGASVVASVVLSSISGEAPLTAYPAVPANTFYVAADPDLSTYLNGSVDEFLVFKRALSQAELNTLARAQSMVYLADFATTVPASTAGTISLAPYANPEVGITVSVVTQGATVTLAPNGFDVDYTSSYPTSDSAQVRISKGALVSRTATIAITVS